MKRFLTFLPAVLGFSATFAQNTDSAINGDSLHNIDLKELSVSTNKKTSQQRLVHFFKSNNASTLEDILGRLPEISLLRRGTYGMEPVIRYFSGGQINIQVDGMRIHGACTDKMDPATIYIEPVNLDKLLVQTANGGFMNGSAIGGTVNMKITEPSFRYNNKLTGIINSGYQSAANSFYESLRLNFSSGKLAFVASGTYRNSKNYRSGGGEVVPFSQYKKINYALSVKYQQNKNTYFKTDILADDGWNIGYPALPMDVGYAAARIISFSMHKENLSRQINKWQTKIYANRVRHFMDDSKRPDVPMHMDMPGESKTYGIYTEAEVTVNPKQKLNIRADGSFTFLKASMTMYQDRQPGMYMLTWPDNRINQYGLSASWLWQMDSSLHLQLTGRMDLIAAGLVSEEAKNQVSIFNEIFTGRTDFLKNFSAQVSKKISRRLKLTYGVSYTERMPTATELFGFYLFNASDGYDYIGNTELKSEKSFQADISLLYARNRSRVQINAYYSRVFNFIAGRVNPMLSSMTIGANGVKSYISIPYATVTGAEGSGFFKPLTAIDMVTTIRYTMAIDNKNDPLPFVAPLKNITSIRYQPNKFSVQLETESALGQNRVSKQYGEDATAGYILLHTRLGFQTVVFKNNIELQAGAENVFDRKYHEHLDWGNIARPGRNIYVQLKMSFNN